MLLNGPAPEVKGDMYFYGLYEAALLDRAPAPTARFLTAFLSQEDGHDLWDLDQVRTMVSQLIDLDPTELALRPLCEQLGKLGSTRALEFQVGSGDEVGTRRQLLGPDRCIVFVSRK